jgi:hypothetical protein
LLYTGACLSDQDKIESAEEKDFTNINAEGLQLVNMNSIYPICKLIQPILRLILKPEQGRAIIKKKHLNLRG